MTQKEIFKRLENMITSPVSTSVVAYRTALTEIYEHLDRYKWHDLEADPEDLPPADDPDDFFLISISTTTRPIYDHAVEVSIYADGEFDVGPEVTIHAWRRIEPFEDENFKIPSFSEAFEARNES